MTSDRSRDPAWAVADARREMSCRFDPELRLLWADRHCASVDGDDMIGLCFPEMLPPADRAANEAAIRAIVPDHPRTTTRHRFTARDGRVTWQEWTIHGVFDALGNIVEYHALGRDVTSEMDDEERRLAAEIRLRRAIAATGLGTWEHTLSTKIDCFDARALEILGFHAGGSSGHIPAWTERVHPGDLDRVVAQWEKAAAGEGHWDCEYRVRTESGAWVWIHSIAIDRSGGKIVGILSDISDRKRAEERLRESERRLQFALEAADEGLWDFDVRSGGMELSDRSPTCWVSAAPGLPMAGSPWCTRAIRLRSTR
ncbi:MAG TPA: PAS domain-containing protein [Geminicoccus sp.]|jgi:PAS domain S-box-containing protein|uniref:PAS domain-containing protein n=1 Tax=Geminicoccus sp. TaxID=2024832 RepID=UPI002E30649F|nr:PAS domain-containing protein [Geminicoccus sp.]HEX2525214.1 PAS domain-containing protein [Geminicoccus sp.]